MVPITKEQWRLYGEVARDVEQAKSRLGLVISTILAGHGVTEGEVVGVTAEGIMLKEEAKEG